MAVIGLLTVAVLGYIYADSLVFLFGQWGRDDYSHGPFIPIISAVLIWQRWTQVARVGISPSWWGPLLVAIGMLLFILGDYATLYVVLLTFPRLLHHGQRS